MIERIIEEALIGHGLNTFEDIVKFATFTGYKAGLYAVAEFICQTGEDPVPKIMDFIENATIDECDF